jgi:membrane associated rhomboid family serine protease
MNWVLIAVTCAAFVVQQRSPQWFEPYVLNPREPSLVAYLTYPFLHGGLLHLLGNMLFLYIFGNNVNDKTGHLGYLGFYLAGGVFAGVGHTLLADTAVIGASGAVAAVAGAYLVLFPRSSVTIVYVLLFVGTVEIPSLWFVAFFFLKDLVSAFSGQPSGVAHMAHVSGTVFGFGVCLALLAVALLPRNQFDVLALVQRWHKRRQYRDLVSKGYDPFGYTPPPARPDPRELVGPDPLAAKIQDLRAEISESIAHHNHPHAALLFLELKRLDPKQVLSRQAQLDVANQLASQQRYADAAEAYEQFLTHYANFEQLEQVELMLGLIYARYLERYDRAKEILLRAAARLHGERESALARAELARIEPFVAAPPAGDEAFRP